MHSHVITLEHNTTVNLSQQGQKNVYVPIKKMIRLNHIAKIYLHLQN